MAEEINATCAICGKGYHMCLSCKDQIKLNPWKRHTDTSEHFKIYQVIHGYNTGVYNKREAKAKLKRIKLDDIDSLRENIRNIINDILGEAEQAEKKITAQLDRAKREKPAVEPVIEDKNEPVVEVDEQQDGIVQ